MGYLASRSVLTLINRVFRESGLPEVSVITGKQAIIVLEAMNDAFGDIWQRHRWTFQRYTASLVPVDAQQEYTLPADFDRMASPFRYGTSTLDEKTPEEWWTGNYGDITNAGAPYLYTIEGLTAKFYPIPNAAFITSYPLMKYQYFKALPARRTTSDAASSWDLPLDFEDAMVHFGKARFKQFLEYPDWTTEQQAYEQALKTLRDKYREVRVAPRLRSNEIPMVW
jgi:hypothetical protein